MTAARWSRDAFLAAMGGAPAAAALSSTAFAAALLTPFARELIGGWGVAGITAALVVLAGAVVVGSRDRIEWTGLLPLTVLGFLAWTAVSVLWSGYQSSTLVAVLYQASLAFIGIVVALTRDMIQLVRSLGGVMRALLALSLLTEILSGIIINVPFERIGVTGSIATGGPIQGLFGTRNYLGFVALIALVTFVIEWRTRTVSRRVFIASASLAGVLVLFSQSPATFASLAVLVVAALALTVIRRAAPETRRVLQWALLSVTAVTVVAGYALRGRIISALDAATELDTRYALWSEMWRAIQVSPLEGWGWAGHWLSTRAPYVGINISVRGSHGTGLNAFLDAALQVGIVGALLLGVLVIVAFTRAWLVASNRRTITYTWPALVLVVLVTTSMAESFILTDGGWLLLIVCAVRAAHSQSWRGRLRQAPLPAPPSE